MLYITKSPTYNQTLLALSPGILKRKKKKKLAERSYNYS